MASSRRRRRGPEDPPKRLFDLVEKYPHKVEDISNIEWEPHNYWIFLRPGWEYGGMHAVHESTVAGVVEAFHDAVRCFCEECVGEEDVKVLADYEARMRSHSKVRGRRRPV